MNPEVSLADGEQLIPESELAQHAADCASAPVTNPAGELVAETACWPLWIIEKFCGSDRLAGVLSREGRLVRIVFLWTAEDAEARFREATGIPGCLLFWSAEEKIAFGEKYVQRSVCHGCGKVFGSVDAKGYCADCSNQRSRRIAALAGNIRRLREIKNGGDHSEEQWVALVTLYDSKCLRCGSSDSITKDHIQPVLSGGCACISNLQPLCRSCNSWKGARTINYRDNRFEEHSEVLSLAGFPSRCACGEGVRRSPSLIEPCGPPRAN